MGAMKELFEESTNLQAKIKKLESENEDLRSRLTDLLFEQNYSIEKHLAELVRNIYEAVNIELKDKQSKLTKKEILNNLKNSLTEFAKDYRFKL